MRVEGQGQAGIPATRHLWSACPLAAEIKFLVTPGQGDAIREWARARLNPDPYGSGEGGDRCRTSTLYFDTPAHDVFHRRGSYGRSKYRIRRYDTSDMVFLERKLRTNVVLSKRRSLVRTDEMVLLTLPRSSWPRGWHGAWFGDRLSARGLAPVCQVTYERIARLVATPYGDARLTLDSDVHAWPNDTLEFQAGKSEPVLERGVIVEMKYRSEIPAVFKALVETFQLNPAPVSKYRASVAALRLAPPLSPGKADTCPAS